MGFLWGRGFYKQKSNHLGWFPVRWACWHYNRSPIANPQVGRISYCSRNNEWLEYINTIGLMDKELFLTFICMKEEWQAARSFLQMPYQDQIGAQVTRKCSPRLWWPAWTAVQGSRRSLEPRSFEHWSLIKVLGWVGWIMCDVNIVWDVSCTEWHRHWSRQMWESEWDQMHLNHGSHDTRLDLNIKK